jgi:hypothetical protein
MKPTLFEDADGRITSLTQLGVMAGIDCRLVESKNDE